VLSLGAKYLNVKSKIVTYANEAVLPFYIFHQTIILCVGWFVIRWNMGNLSKYLIIAVVSFALIMVLYEMLVRPFNVVRFIFGVNLGEVIEKPDGSIYGDGVNVAARLESLAEPGGV